MPSICCFRNIKQIPLDTPFCLHLPILRLRPTLPCGCGWVEQTTFAEAEQAQDKDKDMVQEVIDWTVYRRTDSQFNPQRHIDSFGHTS